MFSVSLSCLSSVLCIVCRLFVEFILHSNGEWPSMMMTCFEMNSIYWLWVDNKKAVTKERFVCRGKNCPSLSIIFQSLPWNHRLCSPVSIVTKGISCRWRRREREYHFSYPSQVNGWRASNDDDGVAKESLKDSLKDSLKERRHHVKEKEQIKPKQVSFISGIEALKWKRRVSASLPASSLMMKLMVPSFFLFFSAVFSVVFSVELSSHDCTLERHGWLHEHCNCIRGQRVPFLPWLQSW